MKRVLTSVATTAALALFVSASAMAATVIDKKTCMQAVADAKEAAGTAAVGE